MLSSIQAHTHTIFSSKFHSTLKDVYRLLTLLPFGQGEGTPSSSHSEMRAHTLVPQFPHILSLLLLVSADAFVPIPRISRPTSPSILQPSMCVCPFPASLRRISLRRQRTCVRAESTDDVQRRRRRLRHVATGAFWRMQRQEADTEEKERSSLEGSFSSGCVVN